MRIMLLMICLVPTMPLAHAVAETQTLARLKLELTDGRQIFGVAETKRVQVHVAGTKLQLSWRKIEQIRFHSDHEHVTIQLCEGDELLGVIDSNVFRLSNAFQPADLRIAEIKTLKVLDPLPVLSRDELKRVLHGNIQEWNSQTGELTLHYDFDSLAELQDWEDGSINSDGRLVAHGRSLRLLIPFESVHSIRYEGVFYSGSGRIRVGVGGLATELDGHGHQHLIYQAAWRKPLAHASGTILPRHTYLASIKMSGELVQWDLDELWTLDAQLQRPLKNPAYLSVGHALSRTGYDELRIQGVLHPEFVQKLTRVPQ